MNGLETKNCQNCHNQFTIEPEDFDFYKKINVPPPTWCPECRLKRRLVFFNLRSLYRRVCDLCKEEKISMYPPEASYTIYCPRCWWSDAWDPFSYGRDYNFLSPFFKQLNDLWHEVPLLGLSLGLECLDTSPHNNHAGHLKNCYFLFHSDFVEDSAYGVNVLHDKSVFDCSLLRLCEYSYDCVNNFKNNHCIGAVRTTESLNCIFTRDCENCQNCFSSANLRGKKYHIFNKPYTKEGYFKEIKKWDLGSWRGYQELKQLAEEHWVKFPPNPRLDRNSVNVTGSYMFDSKNCKQCFEVTDAQDSKYLHIAQERVRDCYDISAWGNNLSLSYEGCVVGENSSELKFCQESGLTLLDSEYSKLSTGGSHHFACVSVKKGSFVIFNKRYEKEKYHELRKKIVAHMNTMPWTDTKGRVHRYGEFFPPEMSPNPYNGSIAQDFFPLTRGEAKNFGCGWRDLETRTYAITKRAVDLPDHIKDTPRSIVHEVIECTKCGKGFRIIPMEFDFLVVMNVPLPRECPFCRLNKKFQQWIKNMKSLIRKCSICGGNIETFLTEKDAQEILCKRCWLEGII